MQDEAAGLNACGAGPGDQLHSRLIEQVAHRFARTPAEQRQRRALMSGQRQLGVGSPLLELGGGEQRQLVDRQRPLNRSGDREHDLADLAVFGCMKKLPDLLVVAHAAVGEGSWECGLGGRADREQQRVEGDLGPRLRVGDPRLSVDAAECIPAMRCADVPTDLGKRDRGGRCDPERLCDRQSGQNEFVVRRDQLEIDAPVRRMMEGQRRLYRRDAPTGDRDFEPLFLFQLTSVWAAN